MAFDDDDIPTALAGPSSAAAAAAGEDAPNAEDDDVPDFKLFKSMFEKKQISSKSIRKGEKDFESHGTRAQDGALELSRQAMEEVLGYTRVHRKDQWVRAWYFPEQFAGLTDDESNVKGGDKDDIRLRERVVVVEHAKGSWMKDIGRVCPPTVDRVAAGKMWLLPEEALYLVERGTVDLWWPNRQLEEILPGDGPNDAIGPDDYDAGLPLSLEAAYSLLVGPDGERGTISLPKYQVYTTLKRGGFSILRAPNFAPPDTVASTTTFWTWLSSLLSWDREPDRKPNGPLVAPGLYRAYGPIYQRLAILPRHKPSPIPSERHETEDPFKVFYHVWQSSGAPFSKKNPRPPEFRIAVSDTVDSFVPDLEQIEALLGSTPYDPPKLEMQTPNRLYQRLKHGHRNVLIAVVDHGLVNFMRFGEGSFGSELLYERFDNSRGGRRGGKRGGGRGGGRGRGRGRGRR